MVSDPVLVSKTDRSWHSGMSSTYRFNEAGATRADTACVVRALGLDRLKVGGHCVGGGKELCAELGVALDADNTAFKHSSRQLVHAA
jgi:hypothetical protein